MLNTLKNRINGEIYHVHKTKINYFQISIDVNLNIKMSYQSFQYILTIGIIKFVNKDKVLKAAKMHLKK